MIDLLKSVAPIVVMIGVVAIVLRSILFADRKERAQRARWEQRSQ